MPKAEKSATAWFRDIVNGIKGNVKCVFLLSVLIVRS